MKFHSVCYFLRGDMAFFCFKSIKIRAIVLEFEYSLQIFPSLTCEDLEFFSYVYLCVFMCFHMSYIVSVHRAQREDVSSLQSIYPEV